MVLDSDIFNTDLTWADDAITMLVERQEKIEELRNIFADDETFYKDMKHDSLNENMSEHEKCTKKISLDEIANLVLECMNLDRGGYDFSLKNISAALERRQRNYDRD